MSGPAAQPIAAAAAPSTDPRGWRRLVVYQRERFPLLAHAPLIAAFTSAAVCLSALLRAAGGPLPRPGWPVFLAAFGSGLAFFFQLRVSDEFKDAEEDARWRPYRAVPRGLVTLRELALLAAVAAAGQLALALWIDARLLVLLLLVWTYMALMGVEFFAGPWLQRHPITLLWTHMLVVPMIDLYATAYDWLPAHAHVAHGLGWFLGASFCNGIVVELGRKLRAPADEEPGVETYSARYGPSRSALTLLAMMGATLLCAWQIGRATGHVSLAVTPLGILLAITALAAIWFLRAPRPGRGRTFEVLSGLWTLALYGAVGIAPYLLAVNSARPLTP